MHTRKNALDTRRGEGCRGPRQAESGAAGGTSTDQPPAVNSFYIPATSSVQEVWTQPSDDKHRTNITPRNANAQELEALAVTAPRTPARTVPSVALATIEQQEAFAEAVIEHEGICPAATAWGLTPCSVFYHASSRPEFRKMLTAAQGAVFETQVYKLDDMCNTLLDMAPREMNQCANAYGRVFDYRMRIVGKLLPVIYGDRPGTQVNIQNNTGIVCSEETRERLIALNQKLLTAGSTTTNQEE